MKSDSTFSARISVRIHKERSVFGPGTAQLLRCIVSQNSVRNAAKLMDLSYSKAWKIIKTAEEELGYSLIERQHGGKAGGSASLTVEGKELLENYEKFNKDIQAYANKVFSKYF